MMARLELTVYHRCFFVPYMFIAQLAQSKGIDESRSMMLVTAMGIVNIVARVLCG